MKEPTQTDIALHIASLQIAAAIRSIPHNIGDETSEPMKDDLIEAYRACRRWISEDDESKRFGATSAYRLLRFGELK